MNFWDQQEVAHRIWKKRLHTKNEVTAAEAMLMAILGVE